MGGKSPSKRHPLGDDDWGPPPGKPGRHPRSAIAALGLEAIASALLLHFAAHVRVDRGHRMAVVEFVGPLAAWGEAPAAIGWGLTILALVPATKALERRGDRRLLAYLAILLAIVNMFGCLLYASATED